MIKRLVSKRRDRQICEFQNMAFSFRIYYGYSRVLIIGCLVDTHLLMTSHFLCLPPPCSLVIFGPVHPSSCSTIKDKNPKSSRPSVYGASLSRRHRHSWCNSPRLGKDLFSLENQGNEKTRNPPQIQKHWKSWV